MKQKPQWVLERERLNKTQHEVPIFIGKMGADGVKDGKLPNGEPYVYSKRR